HAGPPWYDGLIYEMIRGSADFLIIKPDPELEAQLDGYIARIAAAAATNPNSYLTPTHNSMSQATSGAFTAGYRSGSTKCTTPAPWWTLESITTRRPAKPHFWKPASGLPTIC